MSDEWVVFPIEDDDSIDARWQHSKANSTTSVELYVELLRRGNQALNVTSNPSPTHTPTPMPIITQETPNPSVPSPSSTPSDDPNVNLGESSQLIPWDDGNESNELIDSPSEDDVDVDEETIANDIIVPPTPYAQCPPLDEYEEDNSWRTWVCDTTYTEDGELEKGMIFDSKVDLLEAVRVYHIRRNVEYRTETSNQTSLSLKCKRGCSWKLRARVNPYSTSWFISKYNGKHGNCVLTSDTASAGHIHLTSSVINNVIRNCVSKDPSIKVSVVRQMVKDRFGIEVTYKLAWCAKQQALLSIYGTWEDSYSLLPRFLKALQQCNPGIVVEWFFKEDNDVGVYVRPNIRTFQRVFWAFRPSIEGFKFCKPLIAIDGTHLYGKYCHTLLTAIVEDGNKGIFALAFALVENEYITAWS